MSTYDNSVELSTEVFFETINGKQVFVTTNISPDSKQLVLMCHGFRGTGCGPARQFVDFSNLLNKHGISSVRFDQPGSGDSNGNYIDSSFSEWVETTIFLTRKYIQMGYQVILMGQSMGATTCVIVSNHPDLRGKIPALLLWVPDPKTTIVVDANKIYEEAGEKYYGLFWQEAKSANFFSCFKSYQGKIHLVYGEDDRYIEPDLRKKVISLAEKKDAKISLLLGENHSPWCFDHAQQIMIEHLELLKTL